MAIPLSIFYYIYLVFVAGFLLYTFFNVYHLVRFGFLTVSNVTVTVFYLIASILILTISWGYIGQIDWHQTFFLVPSL